MIKTVLFDLDGTLLPMDQDVFTRVYFKELVNKFSPRGYQAEKLVNGVLAGTAAMVNNDGKKLNCEVFWDTFRQIFGKKADDDFNDFEKFYLNEFHRAREVCGLNALAAETVQKLKADGLSLVLASNPVFPDIAQRNRMCWAGIDPDDFIYITSYENSRFCKPNPDYYREILIKLALKPEECLMAGNDAEEDMAAEFAGMKVFLMPEHLINRRGADISRYPAGGFPDLLGYIEKLNRRD